MNEGDGAFFRETQHFRQWWMWVLMAIVVLPIWVLVFYQLVLGTKVGDRPAPNVAVVGLWLVFGLLFPYFIYSAGLTVEVRRVGLFYRFRPFHLKFRSIPFDQIINSEAVTYHPMLEYGG